MFKINRFIYLLAKKNKKTFWKLHINLQTAQIKVIRSMKLLFAFQSIVTKSYIIKLSKAFKAKKKKKMEEMIFPTYNFPNNTDLYMNYK